ncbi:MAG: ATP-binding protein [Alphaproteobacteria bacterium]|nr:ATP-binding protein [Alphaproteobacteria bacterium]
MKYLHRSLELCFLEAATSFPVLLITGPRQVGKTTFLKHVNRDNRTYVTLDDPMIRNLAKEDPKLFMQRFPPPIIIDEIQYAPELLSIIKIYVDENRKSGQFWLTGSQVFHLMNNITESLAGRVAILNMLGFSMSEIIGNGLDAKPFIPGGYCDNNGILIKEIYKIIWRGSYPAICLTNKPSKDLFYSSYIQTYLQRDVRDLANVGDERAFLNFLRAAAARSGQLLNINHLSRDANISPPTAKKWLSILESSGIIYLLEPYFTNLTKRIVKAPKLYFLDTGLCSYLGAWSSPDNLELGAASGSIFETFVVSEIIKSYIHNGVEPPIYYYRDRDMKEIDLLIIENQTVYPIEIKKTMMPDKSAIKNFCLLGKLNLTIGNGAVICLVDKALPITNNVNAIPVNYI